MIKLTIKKDILEIDENKIITIVGANYSGKTYISKELSKNKNMYLISNKKNELLVKEYISEEIIKKFNLTNLKEYKINTLSNGERELIEILYGLINYKTIIFTDSTSNIDNLKREKIFKYIKDNKITLINITNKSEDIIYGDKVIIVKDRKIVLNIDIKDIINHEKDFRDNNIDLPFMVELSLKLKYYNLINKPIFNMTKMVNKLWK